MHYKATTAKQVKIGHSGRGWSKTNLEARMEDKTNCLIPQSNLEGTGTAINGTETVLVRSKERNVSMPPPSVRCSELSRNYARRLVEGCGLFNTYPVNCRYELSVT